MLAVYMAQVFSTCAHLGVTLKTTSKYLIEIPCIVICNVGELDKEPAKN